MQEYKIDILGLGHPRTGTKFTSKLINSWGMKVGHETIESDGIIAWQLTVKNGPWPYMKKCKFNTRPSWNCLIYNIRNPIESIPSIVYTETTTLQYRKDKFKFEAKNNSVEEACLSILKFDEEISSLNPDVIYRIEYEEDHIQLFDYLKQKGYPITYKTLLEKVNARKHNDWKDLILQKENVSLHVKEKMNVFCEKYRYPLLFNA
jgi:hypothetical protein